MNLKEKIDSGKAVFAAGADYEYIAKGARATLELMKKQNNL